MDNNDSRIAFAEFLKRLGTGTVGLLEWNRFIVTHYDDELLEDIRRHTASLAIGQNGGVQWSDSELESLQHWSRQLRGSQ